MTTETGYNGWTNYETWAANLHIDNDEASQSYWRDAAREAIDGAKSDETWTRQQRAWFTLEDRLKAEHEEAVPELEGVYQDLLSAALSDVNWRSIAKHMIDAAWTTDDDE